VKTLPAWAFHFVFVADSICSQRRSLLTVAPHQMLATPAAGGSLEKAGTTFTSPRKRPPKPLFSRPNHNIGDHVDVFLPRSTNAPYRGARIQSGRPALVGLTGSLDFVSNGPNTRFKRDVIDHIMIK
jgi:hypothetical protein